MRGAEELYSQKPPGPLQDVQMLIRYKVWADDLTFRAVSLLPPEELEKKRETTFGSILHTLNHIYVVDDIFRAHLEGRRHGYQARNTAQPPKLEDLWQAVLEMDGWYVDLADRLSAVELDDVLEFEFVGGGAGAMTRREILLHLVNHATYHRGFVSVLLDQVPADMPANDLPVFLRDIWQVSDSYRT